MLLVSCDLSFVNFNLFFPNLVILYNVKGMFGLFDSI